MSSRQGTDGPADAPAGRPGSTSKTLHHGLQVLELLVGAPDGMSITEIADGIGVHRTVAHRLVRTLEEHHLCRRDRFKRVTLGAGLVRLAEPVEQDLRTLGRPLLEELSEQTDSTAHLVVRENADQVRMLMLVEPRAARIHVSFRTGQLDPIGRGSAGLALLAAEPAQPGERDAVALARRRGFAVSHGEIAPGVTGISAVVPARRPTGTVGIGLSLFEVRDEQGMGERVVAAAERLARLLG